MSSDIMNQLSEIKSHLIKIATLFEIINLKMSDYITILFSIPKAGRRHIYHVIISGIPNLEDT